MEKQNKEKKLPQMAGRETKHAVRTRSLISRGFAELMQEKNFDDITILDICEKAMITRATFYKYYEDKYHLVLCVLNDCSEALFQKAGKGDPTKTTKQVYENVLSLFLQFLGDNKKEFQRFFKVGCNEKLRAMLLQKISNLLEDILKEDYQNFKLKIPIEVVSNFITGGFAQILLYVFENDKTYAKEDVTQWVNGIFDLFYEQKHF